MVNSPSPIVSVITPTYNRADLLPKTIESVLSQDFDDLELLIVDDGSSDNTADVVKEIRIRDHRLHYLKLSQNQGIGFARDFGMRNALGKYIAWNDSDDLWLPDKLKTQVEIMEKYPEIEILFGDFWNINHLKGTKKRAFIQYQTPMALMGVRHLKEDLYLVEGGIDRAILVDNFIHLQTVLFRARIKKKISGFNDTLSGSEDFEFFWRAAVLGVNFAYIDRILVERHIDESSVTSRSIESSLQMLKAFEICRQTCKIVDRIDLLSHIRAAEDQKWRLSIRKHAENSQRGRVWQVYWKSLKYGFSLRTFAFFVIGLGGSQAMSLAMRLRTTLPQPQNGRVHIND